MNLNLFSRLTLLVSLAVTSVGASAQTSPQFAGPPFSALFVFGDSLSDGGNNNLVFGGLAGPNPTGPTFIASLPYPAAPGNRPTYSNGPVWVNSFAAGLGLATFATPSLFGGGNYAYGGARMAINGTGAPPFAPAPFPASLQTQLSGYLSTNTVTSSALYVIAGGGNDVRAVGDAVALNPGALVSLTTAGATAFATSAAGMVSTLRSRGAQNIVVWNVPDVGKTPASGSGVGPAAGAASFIARAFNAALATELAGSGATIFDTFGAINNFVANPSSFGFTNVTQACGFAGNGCNASTALFWDGIHPTAFAQTVIANQMLAVAAIPEPASMLLLGMGVLALLAWRRRA